MKYKYKVVETEFPLTEYRLNTIGKEGFQLVSVIRDFAEYLWVYTFIKKED